MVAVTVAFKSKQVERMLERLPTEVGDIAVKRTINRVAEQAKTRMSREIRQEFNLSKAKVDEKLQTSAARSAGGKLRFAGKLLSYGPAGRRAINLINFQARQAKRRGRIPGITTAKIKKQGGRVALMGQERLGAFIGNQGRTVFVRTGKARLPIRPLQTIDVPQMFNTKRINSKVRQFITAKFGEVFARELRFALRQARAA